MGFPERHGIYSEMRFSMNGALFIAVIRLFCKLASIIGTLEDTAVLCTEISRCLLGFQAVFSILGFKSM